MVVLARKGTILERLNKERALQALGRKHAPAFLKRQGEKLRKTYKMNFKPLLKFKPVTPKKPAKLPRRSNLMPRS